VWECEKIDTLLATIESFNGVEDAWIWRPGEGGDFSVSSTIEKLMVIEGSLNCLEKRGFAII